MFIHSTAPYNFCCTFTRRTRREKCASLKVSCLLQPYRLFWQALNYSDRHHVKNPNTDIASILLATRGIIFLGTPHRGSGTESLSKLVAAIVQSVRGRQSSSRQPSQFGMMNERIDELNSPNDWTQEGASKEGGKCLSKSLAVFDKTIFDVRAKDNSC